MKKSTPNSTTNTTKSQCKHSTPVDPRLPKYVFEERYDLFTLKQNPCSEVYIIEIARKLIHWAKTNEDALKISQFCTLMDLYPQDLRRWRERCPEMEIAYRAALQIIGDRREVGGLKKKLDPGMISTTMPHYDQDWKDLAEWRSKLTKDEQEGKGNVTIVMEKFPNSDLVPEKKSE